MIDRGNLMMRENPEGWIVPPKFSVLQLPLHSSIEGVKVCRITDWDAERRHFERFIPGEVQAINVMLGVHNTELRFDNRTIMNGMTPIGTFAPPPGARLAGRHLAAPDFVRFHFEPHGMAAVLEDMSIDPHTFELRPIYIPADAMLLSLSRRLAACIDILPALNTLFLDSLLQSCLNQLIRRHATNGTGRVVRAETLTPVTARRVIDFIEEEIPRSISLPDLARVAGVSRAHFARAFRNVIGITPHIYVLQRRLERALQLLHRSPMRISDVAMATGFSDHAHLTRTFRHYFGVPPSAIRG